MHVEQQRQQKAHAQARRLGGLSVSSYSREPRAGYALRLTAGGLGGGREGFVGAFDVDGGNLCAHGPEIYGKLAAMVDGMADRKTQVGDGGVIQQADVVNRGRKVFAGQSFETRQTMREVFII